MSGWIRAVMLGAAALAGPPAAALEDLTGGWEGALVCDFTDCLFSPLAGGWLLQAVAKAKPGSEKGSLKGELIGVGVGGGQHQVQVCKLKLKRTSLTIPAPITGCP